MTALSTLDRADAQSLAGFDAIIDVRSPGEFAEDHIPGAVNLPVLDDEERARVGTLYVQQSKFEARRVGAALVAANVARHLQTALADRDGSFRPLLYCWRGGLRSHAMAVILAEVGWRTTVLKGGYKTYRAGVQARLYEQPLPHRLVLIDGHTGSAKTEILGRLKARGVQTLDLEGLAHHRGSLFGGFADRPQPPQKLFETQLLEALDALDPARPVAVEAESSKIGERMTPPSLWALMRAAPRIEIRAPAEARARYLVTAYADIVQDRFTLDDALARLPFRAGKKRLAEWRAMAEAGDFETLALELMATHYDPAYDRSSRKDTRRMIGAVEVEALDTAGQERAAQAIARLI